MHVDLVNGERSVINNILTGLNTMEPKRGVDLDMAEMVTEARKDFELMDFNIPLSEIDNPFECTCEVGTLRWVLNRLDERLKEKSMPAGLAEYIVSLRTKLTEWTRAKNIEDEGIKDDVGED